jgi:DNA-binding transcriptional LysR family regulator
MGFALTEGPKTQLRLTPRARRLHGALSSAFDLIEEAASRTPAAEPELHLACYGTLAIRWLIPRLGDFAQKHPEIRLQLREIAGEIDFDAMADVDAAIQLRSSGPATQDQTPFMANWYGPVLSPQRWTALDGQADRLLDEPRLHTRTWPQAWGNWAKARRVPIPPAGAERSFDHFSHALEAAAAGLGVGMAPWVFVADDVAAGRLVAPLGFIRLPGRLALIRPAGRPNAPLDRFAEWLVDQGARTPAPPRPPKGQAERPRLADAGGDR